MKLPLLWIGLAAAGVAHASDAAAGASLCSAQETAYFSCVTARQRVVSLCGTGATALQYRFGRPGSVELTYPQSASDGSAKLLYAHYSRYQTDRIEVRFENAGTDYALFDYREGKRRSAGVRVTTADTKEHVLNCTGRIDSRLGELEHVLPCDTDSALNGGTCR